MSDQIVLTDSERELIELRRRDAATERRAQEAAARGEFDIDSIKPNMPRDQKEAAVTAIRKAWTRSE